MRMTANMKVLLERRSQIDAEIDRLMVRRAEIDFMIARFNGIPESVTTNEPPRRRKNVKKTVMEFVDVAGSAGVTAAEVVERARTIGRELDRGSVSSLLSIKGRGTRLRWRALLPGIQRAVAGTLPSSFVEDR